MTLSFIDRVNTMSTQVIDKAILLDSKNRLAGSITVRYTPSQTGWNMEAAILLHKVQNATLGNTVKADHYSKLAAFTDHLNKLGLTGHDFHKARFVTYTTLTKFDATKPRKMRKNERNAESANSLTDFQYIKQGNTTYKILWAY